MGLTRVATLGECARPCVLTAAVTRERRAREAGGRGGFIPAPLGCALSRGQAIDARPPGGSVQQRWQLYIHLRRHGMLGYCYQRALEVL